MAAFDSLYIQAGSVHLKILGKSRHGENPDTLRLFKAGPDQGALIMDMWDPVIIFTNVKDAGLFLCINHHTPMKNVALGYFIL